MQPNVVYGLCVMMIGSLLAQGEATFKIITKQGDDRVEVKLNDHQTIFVVHSPKGISSAIIERTSDRWPDKVAIQLRLKGMENFKLSTEGLTLEVSVSSQNGDVRLWKDGKENLLLDSESPYWMEIRNLDSNGNQTKSIPNNDGYFEMQIPKKFFEANPNSIKLAWIDFYR